MSPARVRTLSAWVKRTRLTSPRAHDSMVFAETPLTVASVWTLPAGLVEVPLAQDVHQLGGRHPVDPSSRWHRSPSSGQGRLSLTGYRCSGLPAGCISLASEVPGLPTALAAPAPSRLARFRSSVCRSLLRAVRGYVRCTKARSRRRLRGSVASYVITLRVLTRPPAGADQCSTLTRVVGGPSARRPPRVVADRRPRQLVGWASRARRSGRGDGGHLRSGCGRASL